MTQEAFDAHQQRVNGFPGVMVTPSPRKRKREDGFKSQAEADYAQRLNNDPDVAQWKYESLTFVLSHVGRGVRYTPDFLVEKVGGALELHEVKGAYVRPDASMKFKLAVGQYPEFTWVWAQKHRNGWHMVRPEG